MIRFRSTTALFLLCFIILFPQILSVADEGGHPAAEPPPPTFHRIVSHTIALLRKSHKSSWEKIKSIINDMQLEFFPPNLDFRVKDKDERGNGVGGRMKEAVKKSVGTGKATVEESAKFAGEATHKTVEKVKESVFDREEESHDDL
ncbi:hypothetical protein SLA2020_411010 [Shorea laevis]